MLVLGLLLILLSAGTLVAVLAGGTHDQSALYGGDLHLPTLVVFLAGAVTLLVFVLGLELVRSGLKRANRNLRNIRRLRKLEDIGFTELLDADRFHGADTFDRIGGLGN